MAAKAKVLFLGLSLALAAAPAWAGTLRVTSPELVQGGRVSEAQVYNGGGCSGGNRSPALTWAGAPDGTRSFAVTLFDPDAPHEGGWWHWVVFDIPARSTGLQGGAGSGFALPAGAVQARNDFGAPSYGGPCPPPDTAPHRYELTVWALDVPRLPADASFTAPQVARMIERHALDRARIVVRYGR